MVYRSAWEDDTDEPYRETLQAVSFREAVEKAVGTTDVLVVGLFPATEEERLREALDARA